MTELKPCEYCGSYDVQLNIQEDQGGFTVGCNVCGEILIGFETGDQAITAWNTRDTRKD